MPIKKMDRQEDTYSRQYNGGNQEQANSWKYMQNKYDEMEGYDA